MHQGKLTQRQLQAWIENRFYYQWTIPKKDALILAKADDPEFRRAWITRITDHDGIGDSEGGIRKWYKLSEAAGLDVADVASLRYVLPGVRFAVDAYLHLCASRPLTDAVASSLTELFAPTLMADRIVVLEKLYPWLDSRGPGIFSWTPGAGAARLGVRPPIRRCALRHARVAGSRGRQRSRSSVTYCGGCSTRFTTRTFHPDICRRYGTIRGNSDGASTTHGGRGWLRARASSSTQSRSRR